MTNAQNAFRSLFAYIFLIPTALVLGYLLATSNIGPNIDLSSIAPIILVFGLLAAPFLLKWHQALLLATINTTAVLFFLPGSPPFWIAAGALSFGLALGQRALDRQMRFVHAPSIVLPLLVLTSVVFIVGYLTGGFGVRIFGSEQYGGKRYIFIFAAIAAFFAIIAHPIPKNRAALYVGLFFLGSLADVMSVIIPQLPQEFYWLALIFPVSSNDMGSQLAQASFRQGIARYLGLTAASFGLLCFLLSRYGIRGILSMRSWWRFVLFGGVLFLGVVTGFRIALVVLALTTLLVFYFEGLFRTKYAAILLGFVVLTLIVLLPFADKLPLSVQRTLTVLPINLNLNPIARYEAEASSEWRLKMWALVLPEVPKYFFTPKGLGINGGELDLTADLVARGRAQTEEVAMLAGDYHNGPLSLLIPFGVWGLIAWVWFLGASIRGLWLNYRYGPPYLHRINTLLLAYFLTQTIMFFFVFGGFFGDVITFASLIGLSLSLNNGICKAPVPTRQTATQASPLSNLEHAQIPQSI